MTREVRPDPGRARRSDARDDRRLRRRRRGFGLGRLAYWCVVLSIWAGIGLAGLIVWYGAQMPSVADWTVPDRPPNVRIVSADGDLLANRGMTGGEAIGLHEMSPYIPQAVMAIEDRRFYSHFGIDPIGLGRAMVQNALQREFTQGGSTLTQQLAKNLFLTPERTIERKVQEVLMALWLEHRHSKDQILEMYLNRVYFGSGAYGVEAASRRYFGKSARDVSLSEAALLAGLLKAPSKLSPARDPKAAEARAKLVLGAMREEGMIGDDELSGAVNAATHRVSASWTGSENYVADRIVEELRSLVGEIRSDIVVETTVDLHLQHLAEASIRQLIDENRDTLDVSQGALVAIDNEGGVRAMVGGYDYADSQFDRAAEARRQPGSAFKPFVFLAALEQGARPDSVRNDAPIRIGKWKPENYDGKYYGRVTLTTALAKSLNSVAARLAREVGIGSVIEAAQRLGIGSALAANSSLSLGTSEVTPLELTAAYVPFANGGFRPEIHFVNRVTDASGSLIYARPPGKAPRVIGPEIVGMMNTMMAATVSEGTGRKAGFGWPAAGKTGTTQNSRDAWFVGYTAHLTTGVWFGNDDGRPMRKGATGGALPTVAWQAFMTAAHEGESIVALPGDWRQLPDNDPEAGTPEIVLPLPEPPGPGAPLPERGAPLPEMAQPSPQLQSTDHVPTASIDHPVPPANVGESRPRESSILDIILGNGG